jgi:transposase
VTSQVFPEVKEQIETLKELTKSNPDSQEMKRALAAKLVLSGYRYQTIQEILSVSSGFISQWVNAFKLSGLPGLKSRHQGTKGFLSQAERSEVIQGLIEQKAWDISELEVYLIEGYDVVFQSRQSYYKLLKEARIT